MKRPEKTAAATRRARQGGGGFLGMEELDALSPQRLRWSRPHEMINVIRSDKGHEIVGIRGTGPKARVRYTAWLNGQCHPDRERLAEDYDDLGLAMCKRACEREYQKRIETQR